MTIRAHADFVSVIEAAYANAPDDKTWAEAVCAKVGELFAGVVATGATMLRHDGTFQDVHTVFASGHALDASFVDRFGLDDFQRFLDLGGIVSTHAEILPFLSDHAREQLLAQHRAVGAIDAVGIVVQPEYGVSLALVAFTRTPVKLRARQRMRLVQLGLHLQSALRLRMQPDAVRAVVSPDGDIVDLRADQHTALTPPPPPRRGRPPTEHGSSDRLWHALVAGSFSVVPRALHGVPCFGIVENEPRARCFRALSLAEKRVVQHASRGLSNKSLGYSLGLSPSSISRLLESAALKLGFGSRAKLVRLASLLSHTPQKPARLPSDPPPRDSEPPLTRAETDVLGLVRAGLSNRAIAEARGRSERTVANQVAALLRKTGSQNRRRLIAGSFHSAR